jgi:hypothetical protein
MSTFSWTYFFTFIGGMLVVYWMVFVIAVWLKGFLSDQRVSNWLGSGPSVKGYFMGAATGAITPFCSCTTIPLFAGMIESDIRPGYAMSFLIASPTLNPPAILLFWALFGGQLALVYIGVCFMIAVAGGMFLGTRNLDNQLIEFLYIPVGPAPFHIGEVSRQYLIFLRSLGPILLLAAAGAAWLQGWAPSSELVATVVNHENIILPGAVGLGGIIYADIGFLIPIGHLLLGKGLSAGVVFAFMMAASGVGLPSLLLLSRLFSKKLMAMYIATLFTLFTLGGWLVSLWI